MLCAKNDADCLARNSIIYLQGNIGLLNRISLSYDENDVPLLIETYIDNSYNIIENIRNIDYETFRDVLENQGEEYFDILKKSFIDFLDYTNLLLKKEKKRFKKKKVQK